jgi:radical SAM superfamily enzyme YgiQ (UPF0313 family)
MEESIQDKWMLPLDLCSLATYLRNQIPEIEVEIVDGQVMDKSLLLSKVNPLASVVGITYTVFSIDCMEEIAEIAKDNGSFVVVGGQAATASAENLLSNPNIDAVVRYDGEIPLALLIKKLIKSRNAMDFSDIPNILFKTSNSIVFGPPTTFDLNDLPVPSREFDGMEIEKYIKAYPSTCSEKKLKALRPTNAYSKKGCPRSCSFCGRVDKIFRARVPYVVYQEYKTLKSKYKIDYIYDHSDTWVEENWIDEFIKVNEKHDPLNLKYMIFGDVRDINKTIAKKLGRLGVDIILLGLESGCEQLLRKNGKNMSVDEMKACISMLANENIKVSASFVLGLIGEEKRTVDRTISFISDIKKLGDVTIYCNLNIPLPGSPQWRLMMSDIHIRNTYQHMYKYNIEDLRELYIRKFTKITGGLRYLKEIRDMILAENNMPLFEYAR